MSVNNVTVLSGFNFSELSQFVDKADSGENFDGAQIALSKNILRSGISLGFCRRIKVLFSFDDQYTAKKVAEVVKLYLPNLIQVEGAGQEQRRDPSGELGLDGLQREYVEPPEEVQPNRPVNQAQAEGIPDGAPLGVRYVLKFRGQEIPVDCAATARMILISLKHPMGANWRAYELSAGVFDYPNGDRIEIAEVGA